MLKKLFEIKTLRDGFVDAPVYHKAHVWVAVEIKTVKGLQLADGAFREAAIQLVGLNTQSTPVVLLTNFARKHYVLYLTVGSALEFAEDQSVREPISMHFARRPTPPLTSVADEEEDN